MGLLLRLRIALGAGSDAGEESSNSSKGTVDDVEFSVLNGIKVNASTTHADQHIPIVFRSGREVCDLVAGRQGVRAPATARMVWTN